MQNHQDYYKHPNYDRVAKYMRRVRATGLPPKGIHRRITESWENALRVLQAMSIHERIKHFYMAWWGKQTACGTVACLAGWCSLDPWFKRERGISSRWTPDRKELMIMKGNMEAAFWEYGDIIFYADLDHREAVMLVTQLVAFLKDDPTLVVPAGYGIPINVLGGSDRYL